MGQHYVYRLYSETGQLLYVGMTRRHWRDRFDEHAAEKKWWPFVERYRITPYNNYDECALAEIHAIRTERPVFNVEHNDPDSQARQRNFWRRHPSPPPRTGYVPNMERVVRGYIRRYHSNTIPLGVVLPSFVRDLETRAGGLSPSQR